MGRQDAAPEKLVSSGVELRKQPAYSRGIGQFLWHPATLIGIALSISLLIAVVAAVEMISVDPSPQALSSEKSSNIFSTRSRSNLNSPRSGKDALPIFSLGAVAISCAAGSFLLCRCFRPRKPDRRMQFSASNSRTSRTSSSQSAARPNSRKNSATTNPFAQELPPSPPAQVPAVAATIVPANEAHPLDWDEPSIADNLDLRQKRPLSHWL